jgi:hypothetical protein
VDQIRADLVTVVPKLSDSDLVAVWAIACDLEGTEVEGWQERAKQNAEEKVDAPMEGQRSEPPVVTLRYVQTMLDAAMSAMVQVVQKLEADKETQRSGILAQSNR